MNVEIWSGLKEIAPLNARRTFVIDIEEMLSLGSCSKIMAYACANAVLHKAFDDDKIRNTYEETYLLIFSEKISETDKSRN